jgi:predicted NodU family carbamoyl transferase
MKVLGVNFSHNCSFAYFENNVLKEYYEEDRFNKDKGFRPPHPFLGEYNYLSLDKFKNIVFDAVAISSFGAEEILLEKAHIENILKKIKCKEVKFYYTQHHVHHALSGFYFSNFNEALGVVCDGGGERLNPPRHQFKALESIFYVDKKNVNYLYQHFSNIDTDYFKVYNQIPCELNFKHRLLTQDNYMDLLCSNKLWAGLKYKRYKNQAGFGPNQEGQLMGVAAYKDKDTNIDKDVLEIANKAQEETLEERIVLIKKATTYSDCKNIILSGGYHLNCSNNFKLVKHFPKLNFFVDPVPYDGGTAIGAAYQYANYNK